MNIKKTLLIPVILLIPVLTQPARSQGSNDYLSPALANRDFSWGSISDGGITMYFTAGSFAEKHRVMLLNSLKTSFREVAGILGEPGCLDTLNVFYLESRDRMEQLTGRPYAGFSNISTGTIFLVLNPGWRSFEEHEIAHLVTMNCWGRFHRSSGWMAEAVPIYCDGWCGGHGVLALARYLLEKNLLPGLSELVRDYGELGEIRAGISSASLAAFIVDRFGIDTLRDLWLKGSSDIMNTLGIDIGTMEMRWRKYILDEAEYDPGIDYRVITEEGCG